MAREFKIGNFLVNDASDCFVIAEIGHNHQGRMDQCKQLFKLAKDHGADAVKLQKRDNRHMFTTEMYNSAYNSENAFAPTYGTHREALEFNKEQYQELQKYADEIGIFFFSTAFDKPSADFLEDIDMPAYKMASGDITNIPLLKHVASFGKPMIMSTGGATMEDVKRAVEAVYPINKNIAVLQCTAGYPPAWEELNLNVITTFREAFPDVVIGFSAHDSGIAMATASYVLGARIVEKHFTINRAMKGTDHAFSLEKVGLEKMVRDLKRVRLAMGDGVKRQYPTEAKPLFKMAKKIVAERDLPAGHVLTEADFGFKCPNDGLPPYEMYKLMGKQLKHPIKQECNIMFEDVEDAAASASKAKVTEAA